MIKKWVIILTTWKKKCRGMKLNRVTLDVFVIIVISGTIFVCRPLGNRPYENIERETLPSLLGGKEGATRPSGEG